MVEIHLLSVNVDFTYEPIYALGVTTTFDRFMQGYRPEQDKASIFNALCQAVDDDPNRYRHDAEQLKSAVEGMTLDDLKQQLPGGARAGTGVLGEQFQAIAENPKFKYSRLFAIGIYTILEQVAPKQLEDEASREALLEQIGEALNLSADKMQKDLDLYRSNLDKLSQAQQVMAEMLSADRKQREERAQRLADKEQVADAPSDADAASDNADSGSEAAQESETTQG